MKKSKLKSVKDLKNSKCCQQILIGSQDEGCIEEVK